MATSMTRVLIVDDYEPWRRFVSSALKKQPELQIIAEVADGFEAVQTARELKPDLVLLDIGLPTTNGIEAARQIRNLSPASKILVISENLSWEIAKEALRLGANGYVVKTRVVAELLPAIEAVLHGKQFVGSGLADRDLINNTNSQTAEGLSHTAWNAESKRHHIVNFYPDDTLFLDDPAQFIGDALRQGNAAIVVATAPHREKLLSSLRTQGLDLDVAIADGRYIALDAADTLSAFMQDGMPDPTRFLKLLGDLIVVAAGAAKREPARVAIFGECVDLLCEQGNVEAAIQMEILGNLLARTHNVDILCSYSLNRIQGGTVSPAFQRICAEHSAVYLR